MSTPEKKNLSQRDKELLLGNLVTWGSIGTAFVLAILLAPGSMVEVNSAGAGPLGEVVAQADQQDSGTEMFN
ncbi:hypothetical protein [Parasphingorhabdus sp.]|uniref:hypothetical protein n=1 Tax=Parasphingorhabdus sp. TaxID=2709688 RepID=UPI003A95717D